MPNLDSNIPTRIFHDSEILPIARTTTDLVNMATCGDLLLIQIKRQEAVNVLAFLHY